MTSSAILKAAQDILNLLTLNEMSARVIISWERRNRFAGSKDRRKIRDIVYSCLRNKSYLLHCWPAETKLSLGRKLVLSFIYDLNNSKSLEFEFLKDFYGNKDHEFSNPSVREKDILQKAFVQKNKIEIESIRYSYPEFLHKELKESLGLDFPEVMATFAKRGDVFIRANKVKIQGKELEEALAKEGFVVEGFPALESAYKIVNPSNQIKLSALFSNGFFEFQDFASQKIIKKIPIQEGMAVLDFCAGGGGKSLALASEYLNMIDLYAYDIKPNRLKSLKFRADRALAKVNFLNHASVYKNFYDVIIVDAPCSGSGTWRRDPMSKWRLSFKALKEISDKQLNILQSISGRVSNSGIIAYITCSILKRENEHVVTKFLNKNRHFSLEYTSTVSPLEGGDGFFLAILKKIK